MIFDNGKHMGNTKNLVYKKLVTGQNPNAIRIWKKNNKNLKEKQ